MTKFCHENVLIPALGGDPLPYLVIDGNTKISGWPEPKPNAFSLPAPTTCPGATSVCKSTCYASFEGTKIPPELRARYEHNERTIRAILDMPDAGFTAAIQFGRWIAANCQDIGFRWHVSGDVFSDQYAWWIVAVVHASPEVQHWIYTRSLRVAPTLARCAPLLSVNVSADRENFREAQEVAERHALRLTYLWQGEEIPELPERSVIFPDYPMRCREPGKRYLTTTKPLTSPQRCMICPADMFGQSAAHRCGVCTKCGNPKPPEVVHSDADTVDVPPLNAHRARYMAT